MRTIGFCKGCRKFKTVTITPQNLIVNRLEGTCDDCTRAARTHPDTPAPRPRTPRSD